MSTKKRNDNLVRVLSYLDGIFSVEKVMALTVNPELVVWFAHNKYLLGKFDQSARLYEVAAQVETKSLNRSDVVAQALIGQGLAELRLDELDRAERSFKNALAVGSPGASSKFGETVTNLARLADIRKRLRQANATG